MFQHKQIIEIGGYMFLLGQGKPYWYIDYCLNGQTILLVFK